MVLFKRFSQRTVTYVHWRCEQTLSDVRKHCYFKMGDLVNETTPLLSGNGQALLETLDVSHSATTSSRNHGLESSDDDLLPDQNKYRSMSMASSELPDSGQSPQDWQYQEVGPGNVWYTVVTHQLLFAASHFSGHLVVH